eukprot:scaffold13667_cov17-Tisochrysis_lutea.AAC.3
MAPLVSDAGQGGPLCQREGGEADWFPTGWERMSDDAGCEEDARSDCSIRRKTEEGKGRAALCFRMLPLVVGWAQKMGHCTPSAELQSTALQQWSHTTLDNLTVDDDVKQSLLVSVLLTLCNQSSSVACSRAPVSLNTWKGVPMPCQMSVPLFRATLTRRKI